MTTKHTEAKRKERKKRRDMGYTYRQVWVHEDDRELFDEFVENLPSADRYYTEEPMIKLPGME